MFPGRLLLTSWAVPSIFPLQQKSRVSSPKRVNAEGHGTAGPAESKGAALTKAIFQALFLFFLLEGIRSKEPSSLGNLAAPEIWPKYVTDSPGKGSHGPP